MRYASLARASCCGAILIAIAAGAALSHPEKDSETHAHDTQGWKVTGEYRDRHYGEHGEEQSGAAEVWAVVNKAPQHTVQPGVYSVKLKASLWTRLSKRVSTEASIRRDAGGAAIGYNGFTTTVSKVWYDPPIDSTGQLSIEFAGSQKGRTTQVGHKKEATYHQSTVTTPPDETTEIDTGGVPEVTVDPLTGEISVVLDENDDIAWESPPVLLVRLTSSLSESGGVYTYAYRIENFGAAELDFAVPEITTPAYPSGWYGTVDASSYEQISTTGTDDDYSQHATLSVTESDSGYESTQTTTGTVYVPEGRLAFDGTCTITDAYYDGVLQANVVEFHSSEDAELALLVRDSEDGHQEAAEVENVVASVVYELEDDDFVPNETNDYFVRVGCGVNGWEPSSPESISN